MTTPRTCFMTHSFRTYLGRYSGSSDNTHRLGAVNIRLKGPTFPLPPVVQATNTHLKYVNFHIEIKEWEVPMHHYSLFFPAFSMQYQSTIINHALVLYSCGTHQPLFARLSSLFNAVPISHYTPGFRH